MRLTNATFALKNTTNKIVILAFSIFFLYMCVILLEWFVEDLKVAFFAIVLSSLIRLLIQAI